MIEKRKGGIYMRKDGLFKTIVILLLIVSLGCNGFLFYKINNLDSSQITKCSELNFYEALDDLYNQCLQYLNHNYHIRGYSEYSNEPMMIAIASSLEPQ